MSHLIAIVDDDESVRESMNGFVRSLGHEPATFASAEAFLASGRVGDTACLISDVQMPGMSGIDLQGHLIRQGHHVPTIFITAFPDAKAKARALAAGALGFLNKPFHDDSLIACIDKALALRGQ